MKTIYLADDDIPLSEGLADLLAMTLDCAVIQFSDGQSVIAELKKSPPPDLIISDLWMPNGSGLEIWDFLKTQAATPIPFILHSSARKDELPPQVKQEELLFIPKGDPDLICDAAKTALERHSVLMDQPKV